MIKFYFTALKKLIRVINLVFNLMKKKIKKMGELTGKEGQIVSESAFDSLVKSYEDLHGEEDSYLKFATIGVSQLRDVLVPDAVCVRVYNAFNGSDQDFLFVPVDKDGKHLPINRVNSLSRTGATKAVATDTPHCPNQCS